MGMVKTVRDAELSTLRSIGVNTALNSVLWGAVPMLVAFSTFAVVAYARKEPLTADIM